ncbi:MAG: integration host factor subunit beta [Holosporaceae bacterium]|jgi:integration host factor subunit beta|nr:integration host factor subunit beta [Holosporaceae bacterium]
MTKSDLIEKISEIYPYMNIKNVEKVISIVIGEIVDALKNGRRVELRGFGAFSIRTRGKSVGRNPRTGEKVIIPEKSVPFFKSGKHLKDMINGVTFPNDGRL